MKRGRRRRGEGPVVRDATSAVAMSSYVLQLVDMRHDDPERNDGVDIQCLGILTQV